MNIKTKIITALTLAVFLAPGISLAQTMSIAQLEAEIASLTAQLQSLKAQLVTAEESAIPPCYTFNDNLSLGTTGPAVTELQTTLQKDGESVNVNGTFDSQTESAVIAFQEKYQSQILTPNGLSSGTGYVGKSTRAELNSLFGCGSPVPTPITASSSAPSISIIDPSIGSIGTSVTITGQGFGATSTVLMNGDVALTNVLSSDNVVEFTIPSVIVPVCTSDVCPDVVQEVSPGTYNITVQSNGEMSNSMPFTVASSPSSGIFAPFISSLSPTSGAFGTSVTITGQNFGATSTVLMSSFPVAEDVTSSPTSVSFVVPITFTPGCLQATLQPCVLVPDEPGSHLVTVQSNGQTSNAVTFTVPWPAPLITILTPSSSSVGASVTITGQNFGATSTVLMNGIPISGAINIAAPLNELTFTVPSSLSTPCTSDVCPDVVQEVTPGTYNITVQSSGQTSNALTLTVLPPAPVITNISPSTGSIGTSVTITGQNFGATSTVLMNGIAISGGSNVASVNNKVTFNVPSSLAPTCTSGAVCSDVIHSLSPGAYNVTVQSNGETSNAVSLTVVAGALFQ